MTNSVDNHNPTANLTNQATKVVVEATETLEAATVVVVATEATITSEAMTTLQELEPLQAMLFGIVMQPHQAAAMISPILTKTQAD